MPRSVNGCDCGKERPGAVAEYVDAMAKFCFLVAAMERSKEKLLVLQSKNAEQDGCRGKNRNGDG